MLLCAYQINSIDNKNNLIAKCDYFKDDIFAMCQLKKSD